MGPGEAEQRFMARNKKKIKEKEETKKKKINVLKIWGKTKSTGTAFHAVQPVSIQPSAMLCWFRGPPGRVRKNKNCLEA